MGIATSARLPTAVRAVRDRAKCILSCSDQPVKYECAATRRKIQSSSFKLNEIQAN